MSRVTIIQTAFPGDVILASPMFQALKEEDPGCETVAVIRPESEPLFRNSPFVDRTVTFDKYGADKGLSGILKTSSRLKGCQRAYIVQRHFRSALVAYLARIPVRTGYGNSSARMLYTDRIEYRPDRHEVQRCLDLLGIDDAARKYRPQIFIDNETRGKISKLLVSEGVSDDFAVVAPGSVWPTKRYPYYPGLIHLIEEKLNLSTVLTGGTADTQLAQDIADACKRRPRNLTGCTDLLESAALISKARIVFANDSAPVHMAAAIGTPVIAIFGPTVPEFGFAPYTGKAKIVDIGSLYCRPCGTHGSRQCPEKHFRCMLELPPSAIIEAALKLPGV
jgi:heptosyltransferase-2